MEDDRKVGQKTFQFSTMYVWLGGEKKISFVWLRRKMRDGKYCLCEFTKKGLEQEKNDSWWVGEKNKSGGRAVQSF